MLRHVSDARGARIAHKERAFISPHLAEQQLEQRALA